MTLNRFVFKTHKWLAVAVGLFALVWFASGIVMVMPKSMLGGSGIDTRGNPGAADFTQVAITVPQAIATAEAASGGKMSTTNVELLPIEGHLYYRISTEKSGMHLIDAASGTRLEITEEYAKQMAARLMGGRGQARETTLIRQHSLDYATGPLPAYRIAFDDSGATIVDVFPNTGEMRASNRKGRLREFIVGTHTFDQLKPLILQRGTRAVLVLFSLVGLAMSLFGSWILWIQFQNWRARRAGRAETA